MQYRIVLCILLLLMGCSKMRTIGNNEMHFLEPAKCGSIGSVKRDGKCYRRVVVSAKDDAHVVITKPDGTIYDIDNTGHQSFAHDLAATVQAIAIQKAMNDD